MFNYFDTHKLGVIRKDEKELARILESDGALIIIHMRGIVKKAEPLSMSYCTKLNIHVYIY